MSRCTVKNREQRDFRFHSPPASHPFDRKHGSPLIDTLANGESIEEKTDTVMKKISFEKKIVCCLLVLAGLTGCSGGESLPDLATVTGTVSLDGNPLPSANVLFQPQQGTTAFAMTDENGKFELMYNQDVTGATPGSYTVKISKEKNPEEPGNELLPAKYNEQSTLTADVKADQENDFQFDLTTN